MLQAPRVEDIVTPLHLRVQARGVQQPAAPRPWVGWGGVPGHQLHPEHHTRCRGDKGRKGRGRSAAEEEQVATTAEANGRGELADRQPQTRPSIDI